MVKERVLWKDPFKMLLRNLLGKLLVVILQVNLMLKRRLSRFLLLKKFSRQFEATKHVEGARVEEIIVEKPAEHVARELVVGKTAEQALADCKLLVLVGRSGNKRNKTDAYMLVLKLRKLELEWLLRKLIVGLEMCRSICKN